MDSEEAPSQPVEVVLARLLTDTLASLTRSFEKEALASGEVRWTEQILGGLHSQTPHHAVYLLLEGAK